MAQLGDSLDELVRRLRLERRGFGTGTAHARGRRRPGGTARPATRLRLQGRWRLCRGAQVRCARDAGSVGAGYVRARRGAREQARDQVRGSQWPQRLVVASRRVRLPCRLAAAAHPQQRGGVRLGAGGWRNDARARHTRNRHRRRAGGARNGIGVRPALRGPFAQVCAARRSFEPGRWPRAGARPRCHGGDQLAQRRRRIARVALARLRPRARVWRSRHRLGGGRRRPRFRSAELRRRHHLDDACKRDTSRGRTQLRLLARRRLFAAFATAAARSSCRRWTP